MEQGMDLSKETSPLVLQPNQLHLIEVLDRRLGAESQRQAGVIPAVSAESGSPMEKGT